MIPDRIVKLVKAHEGFRAKPYRDTAGKLTIGYGTLLEDGITEEEAELLLRHRLEVITDELGRSPVGPTFAELPDGVFEAVSDMAYNLGVPRLLGFRRMWAALEHRNWRDASHEALDSQWAQQVGARAKTIALAIMGTKNNPGTATRTRNRMSRSSFSEAMIPPPRRRSATGRATTRFGRNSRTCANAEPSS